MAKETKTNAMRFLDKHGANYTFHTYESDGFCDGASVAEKLNQPVDQVFKTLVAKGKSGCYYVFVIPVAKEVNMKLAAQSVSEKSVEMLPLKDLTTVTGYVRGGCSPIGMKKQFKTVIDDTATGFDTIIFSGGRIGLQIEMDPATLAKLISASFFKIAE